MDAPMLNSCCQLPLGKGFTVSGVTHCSSTEQWKSKNLVNSSVLFELFTMIKFKVMSALKNSVPPCYSYFHLQFHLLRNS